MAYDKNDCRLSVVYWAAAMSSTIPTLFQPQYDAQAVPGVGLGATGWVGLDNLQHHARVLELGERAAVVLVPVDQPVRQLLTLKIT